MSDVRWIGGYDEKERVARDRPGFRRLARGRPPGVAHAQAPPSPSDALSQRTEGLLPAETIKKIINEEMLGMPKSA